MTWQKVMSALLIVPILLFSVPTVSAASCGNNPVVSCNPSRWRTGNTVTIGPNTLGDGFLAVWVKGDFTSNFRVVAAKNGITVADKVIKKSGHVYDVPVANRDQVTFTYYDCTSSGECTRPWFGASSPNAVSTSVTTCGTGCPCDGGGNAAVVDISGLLGSVSGTRVEQAQCWSNSSRNASNAPMTDYAIAYTFIQRAISDEITNPTPTPTVTKTLAKKVTTKKITQTSHKSSDTAVDTEGLIRVGAIVYGFGILLIVVSRIIARKYNRRLRIRIVV